MVTLLMVPVCVMVNGMARRLALVVLRSPMSVMPTGWEVGLACP